MSPDLVTLDDPRSPQAEAFRSLRTNLSFARPDQPLRALLIAAPALAADASAVVANLAVVCAQAGQRVLAVDCDLRRPALHHHFGLPNDQGVTSALVDDGAMGAPPLQATGVAGLSVLTSGPVPPNPAELLASKRMEQLIAHLADGADLVLYSAPPIVPVTDAAALAPRLDGVLLVLTAGRSRRDQTQRARQLLDKVGAEVIGVVLTEVAARNTTYSTYGAEIPR
jgi:non-specific protein-tyrosine kinase